MMHLLYPNTTEFAIVANEFNSMLSSLKQVGVRVFLADAKYFPIGHRGVYHTVEIISFESSTYGSS